MLVLLVWGVIFRWQQASPNELKELRMPFTMGLTELNIGHALPKFVDGHILS